MKKLKKELIFNLVFSLAIYLWVLIPSIAHIGDLREAYTVTWEMPIVWTFLFFGIFGLGLMTGIISQKMREMYDVFMVNKPKDDANIEEIPEH